MMEVAVQARVAEEMAKIVGKEWVSTSSADLYIYSQDMTQAEPSWPDVVVVPKTAEEIQAIVRFANREKIPITPCVAAANVGGLTIPLKGGMVLDLKRMDKIEVNETDMYAIVEPGVKLGQIKAYLEKYHPNLRYTYPFSPPHTSVVANALLQGLCNLSFRYGAATHWVSGLEAVLPTGELVKIGSCAVSKWWQERDPLPDLAGLFIGWQGATGVVTKMAVSVWPQLEHSTSLDFNIYELDAADQFLKGVARTRVVDELTALSYVQMKLGMEGFKGEFRKIPHPLPVSPDEPDIIVSVTMSGNTENELNAKEEVIYEVARERGIKLEGPVPGPSITEVPLRNLAGVFTSGGGLTWLGTYGPISNWLEGAKKSSEIIDKYGFTRALYTRVMREGHFSVLRYILPFCKDDPDEVSRLRGLISELCDMCLDIGYIPYKTPVWAIRRIEERADPNWVELLRRVKKMLDPNNIMNPGRWGKPREE